MANVLKPELPAIKQSDLSVVNAEAGKGVTLAANTTYIFNLNAADAPTVGVHLKWDALIVLTTAKIEESCLPRKLGLIDGGGKDANVDIADTSLAKGDWIVWPMPATQVSVISDDASTGGATYTAATGVLAVAGGTQGGAVIHLPDQSTSRLRLIVAVGGTGGVLRVGAQAKS